MAEESHSPGPHGSHIGRFAGSVERAHAPLVNEIVERMTMWGDTSRDRSDRIPAAGAEAVQQRLTSGGSPCWPRARGSVGEGKRRPLCLLIPRAGRPIWTW